MKRKENPTTIYRTTTSEVPTPSDFPAAPLPPIPPPDPPVGTLAVLSYAGEHNGRLVRVVPRVLIRLWVRQYSVDVMDRDVLGKNVRLDDLGGGVARCTEFSAWVEVKVKILASG